MDTRGEVPHIVSSILFILKFYFPALLRYDWHTTLCQFKVYNVIIWYTYTYCKMTTINLVNTSITLYNYYFVWVWWEYLRSIYSEKAMAPHSSTLAWKIPWMEEPGRVQSMGLQRVGHDWATSLSRIGEGNGNPLQCSCLENPRDGGAWWVAVYGVAQSQTRLKWLSSSSTLIATFKYTIQYC